MTSRATTAAATHGVMYSKANPPRLSMSRISSVAYAFEDSGSLQNTGRASFFGRSVSPIIEVCRGCPSTRRLGRRVNVVMTPPQHRPARLRGILTSP